MGCQHGTTVIQLVERTLSNGHSHVTVFPNNTGVYHLSSRPLFEALGDPNNRNRRRRSPSAVKTKLMALDFVLADPERTYLATEREKVDYFANHPKISPDLLPRKVYSSKCSDDETVRYFVDKFPVFVSSAEADSPPVVSFCYVDPGARTPAGFDTFLNQYSRLFRHLGRLRLFYIADTERHFQASRRKVKSLVAFLDSDAAHETYCAGILEYFRLEQLYETGQFHALTRDKLIRLKRARRLFSGPDTESLFRLWKRDGDRAVSEKIQDRGAFSFPISVDFQTCHLERN
ncbi:MAG: hypothetical protein P8Y94_17190, partial [Acidobacteriota bacterium]